MTAAPSRGLHGRPAVIGLAAAAVLVLLAAGCAGSGGTTGGGGSTPDAALTPGVKPQFTVPETAPPGELVVETLLEGSGPEAAEGDTVEVHYVGRAWSTGREFDASWDRGDTLTFELGAGEVIPGWDRGVAGMQVGERRRLVVPPSLAYGERGAGPIGPDETLVFVVDLVGVS